MKKIEWINIDEFEAFTQGIEIEVEKNSIPENFAFRFNGVVNLDGEKAKVIYSNLKQLLAEISSSTEQFKEFVISKQYEFIVLFEEISNEYEIDLDLNELSIYGKWVNYVGKERAFFIYAISYTRIEDKAQLKNWVSIKDFYRNYDRIFNMNQFKKYRHILDLANTDNILSRFIKSENKVKNQCPVLSEFGVNKPGLGIIWETSFRGNKFFFEIK